MKGYKYMEKYRYKESEMECMERSRIPFAVYQFIDKRVVTIVLSDGFRDLFDFTDKENAYFVMDNDMYRDAHPDDAARIADAAFRFATEGGMYDVVYRTRRNKGKEYLIIHAQGEHFYTETGVRLAMIWYTNEGSYSDSPSLNDDERINYAFSKLLREGSMMHHSYYDNLTGLPKMTYFFELADIGRKNNRMSGKSTAILFLDLSGMREFNSKHGFAAGDKLLRAFSKLLVNSFSNENCGRFGQDHFAVYTVFTDIDTLNKKVRAFLIECKNLNGGLTLPVRVGIYVDDDDSIETGTACDRAKMACDSKRNIYISYYEYFDSTMLEKVLKRQYIVDNIDRAIKENWIKVYYQPIVRAANGKVCNEEALARWIDPVKGFLSPADFIPTLEDTLLIYKLDLYVVEQTLLKMKHLKDEGFFIVPSSINLSRADFTVCDMVEEIRRRVDDSGIRRDYFNIEITESIVGSDPDYIKEQVERFRELGFNVWMDDFGSGYSSLDVLQSVPFDLIKFDMKFMQQFSNNDKSKIIMSELVKMAAGLGIKTVAEGVETREQAEFLKEIGCTKLQGYYFCKPIPLEEIYNRYKNGSRIGFENPEEADYYTALGSINLYDPTHIVKDDIDFFPQYFDTLPAAIMEFEGDGLAVTRCNRSYRDFMKNTFDIVMQGIVINYKSFSDKRGAEFIKAAADCAADGNTRLHDEKMKDGQVVHAFIRRIAVNHVTGKSAVAVVVLGVTNQSFS